MRRLVAFESVTVDGYFTGANDDMSWAHERQDAEWKAFVGGNASGEGQLLFGRKTYELMVKYWPTPEASKNDPAVAGGMNALPKVVFSRTLKTVSWGNTKVVKGNLPEEVRKLKKEPGPVMVILGSGSIVSELAAEGLIDEYQIVLTPVAIGKGRTLFEGIKKNLDLKLARTRVFGNGRVVLYYEPTA